MPLTLSSTSSGGKGRGGEGRGGEGRGGEGRGGAGPEEQLGGMDGTLCDIATHPTCAAGVH